MWLWEPMGTASPLGNCNWVGICFFLYLNSLLNSFTIHVNTFEAYSVSEQVFT